MLPPRRPLHPRPARSAPIAVTHSNTGTGTVANTLLPSITGLQHVRVVRRLDHLTALLLLTDEAILHPWVLQDLVHRRPLPWIQFQHAADDVPSFAGKEPE